MHHKHVCVEIMLQTNKQTKLKIQKLFESVRMVNLLQNYFQVVTMFKPVCDPPLAIYMKYEMSNVKKKKNV